MRGGGRGDVRWGKEKTRWKENSSNLEEVVKADMLKLGPIHLLLVLEEEPVGDSDVEQFSVVPVQPHQVQPLSIAVPPTKESFGNPLLPRVPSRLLR